MSTVHGNLFSPTGDTVSASATDSSGSTQVNITDSRYPGGGSVMIANEGSNTVFVKLGGSSVTATTSTGFPVLSGVQRPFAMGGATTHAAVVCKSTETATVYFTPGRGL